MTRREFIKCCSGSAVLSPFLPLGADWKRSASGARRIINGKYSDATPTYITEGLVWMWSRNSGEELDTNELKSELIDMFNYNTGMTLDVCYTDCDFAVSAPQIYITDSSLGDCILMGPRNAGSASAPNPRPFMNFNGNQYYIIVSGIMSKEPWRLGMSYNQDNSLLLRAWNTTYFGETIEKNKTAKKVLLSNLSTSSNRVASVLIYNRALSQSEMDANYRVHAILYS